MPRGNKNAAAARKQMRDAHGNFWDRATDGCWVRRDSERFFVEKRNDRRVPWIAYVARPGARRVGATEIGAAMTLRTAIEWSYEVRS